MSHRVKRFASTLKRLRYWNDASRKTWLKSNWVEDLIHCLCECAQNLLRGKVSLNRNQKTRMKRCQKSLRELVERKVSLVRKKKIIQSGGFLGALLGPIVSILDELLGGEQ